MSRSTIPKSYGGLHALIAGGGVAALEAAFALRALAADLVDIEILAPETRFFYRPQAVVESLGGTRVETFELVELAQALEAQLTQGELASVAPERRLARTSHGARIRYDALVIACGASPRAELPGALTFRGPADTDRVVDLARAHPDRITFAIPRCPTHPLPLYELALGLRGATRVPIAVVTAERAPAQFLGRAGSGYLATLLAERDIALETSVDRRRLDSLPAPVVAAPALRPGRIHGIPADDDDFVPVDRHGAVPGLQGVYAAGDVTSHPIKHGSIAAAQADAAAATIAAHAGAGVVPRPFRPIVSAAVHCGDHTIYVRRDAGDPADDGQVSREPLWSPPAKIAAHHLAPALVQIHRRRGAAAP